MNEQELQYADEIVRGMARNKATQALDGDTDKAAQAVRLEKSTGADAQMIYGNHEEFTANYKNFLTQRMLDRNPDLEDYINSHPMAAIVSKDDWNKMADFYDHLDYWIQSKYLNQIKGAIGAVYGFQQKFREAVEQPATLMTPGEEKSVVGTLGQVGTEFAKGYMAKQHAVMQVLSGLVHGLAGAGEGAAMAVGKSPTEARMFGRTLGAGAEFLMTDFAAQGAMHPASPGGAIINKMIHDRVMKLGEPYLKNDELPPPGIHPVWDAVNRAEVERKMEVYDALVDAVDKTGTKEVSPDMLAKAISLKTKEDVFLHWDAIEQLYKGKVPEAGDGLLGDVPGFIEQYTRAVETAADIQVPLSEWLAKVDDKVRDGLHDDIRFRPAEPTLRESKAFPDLNQAIEGMVKEAEAPGFDEFTISPEQIQDLEIRLAEQYKRTPEEIIKGITGKPMTTEQFLRDQGIHTPEQLIAANQNNRLFVAPEGAQVIRGGRPEDPLDRLSRLRTEHADRLATHGALEHKPTKEGNLLQSLAAVTDRKYVPDDVARAMRWAFLHDRPDIVERALELARKSEDAQLEARLETELEDLNRYRDAQFAIDTEMAQKVPLGWGQADTLYFPTWTELLKDPNWKKISALTGIKVHGDLTAEEAMIKRAMGILFERLGGPQAGLRLLAAREIRMGEPTPYPVTASYVMAAKYGADVPTITFLLGTLDPANSLGHEFMHHLKRYGFLTDKEWAILSKRSNAEWIDKHRVRFKGYDLDKPELLTEEGVAHEFGEWYSNRFEHDPEVKTIFQKIADFIDQLRVALKELFGRDLTAEEIFEKIYRGEVARRPDIAGPDPAVKALPLEREFAQRPEIQVPKIEEAGLLGILPKGREQKYLDLINAENSAKVKHLFEQAYKDELKRMAPEWNLNYAKQFDESIKELKDRPDFRVSAFFRQGKIGDQTMEGLPKLDPKFFTKDEKEALPDRWFRVRDGFAPDDIAGYFGYKTGQEMKNAMIRFEAEKGTGKPETMMERLAAKETERRMKMQYGDLTENAMDSAREHAIGIERFDMMHEETLKLATMAGQQFPFTKKDFKDRAALKFNESIVGQTSLIKYTREIARSNKAVESAWLKGDALGAFVERQRTLTLEAEAEHAKKLEKERRIFDKNRQRFSKREVAGIPPEYTNWIHHIFNRTGKEIRNPADLQREIDATGIKTLDEFLKDKSSKSWLPEGYEELEIEYNPEIPVWEDLKDPNGFNKDINSATVGEFRAINESIKALIHVGRAELKTILEGKAVERSAELDKMVKGFQSTGIDKLPPVGDVSRFRRVVQGFHYLKAGLLQMAYIWGRLDQNPYGGVFYNHFTKPFLNSGNEYRLLIAEYGKKLLQIKQETKLADLKSRSIPNDVFFEPLHGLPKEAGPYLQEQFLGNGYLTRAELRAVMLNVGSNIGKNSNLYKLARGYHTTPEKVMAWVNQHATKQDWDYVQRIWKLFEEIQDKDDIVSRNISGVAMERLPLGKVQSNLVNIDGGYYPMIYDQTRGGGGKGGKIDPDLPPGIRVLTDRGWERKRTNYAGPVSLSLNGIETQLTRRLRNIAFREVLEEAQKFFKDSRFQSAMTRHLGQEYTDLLLPYLRDIAGIRGPIPKHVQWLERGANAFTQNIVTTFVGLNPSTLAKHNFTAFFQSFKEIKNKRYLASAVYDLFNGVENVTTGNKEFVKEMSAEIKGRRPNWMEALGGETDVITGERTARSRIAHFMSAPIAAVDQGISMWLWYAKYREVMDELMPNAAKFEHARTEAIAQADLAVVRTHGSTAITSRPQFMRSPTHKPFVALYGFFNHIFNRMYEISWEARKHKDLQTGEAKRADASHLASQVFWAVVPAAIIEELVTPIFDKDDRSWFTRFGMALGFPITSSMPFVRELAHAMFTGHDPGFGIIQGGMKAITDVARLIKKGPNPDKYGDDLQALITLWGVGTGMGSQQVGRWAKFAYNYFTGRDRPQTSAERYRAFKYGTSRERRH